MELATRDMNEGWNIATQIEQSMEFYSGLCGTKQRPWKNGATQIDGRGVECVNRIVEIEPQVFFCIEGSGDLDQRLGERFDLVVSIVLLHAAAKRMQGKMLYHLGEDNLSYAHDSPLKAAQIPGF